ncbi:MAG TPA: ABATE domain-containing protein, partial [Thermoanaerobaculia bacterium]|nr:ABATE domain-containing protein [Thermoanaerobaculia bacterium]
MSRFVFIGGAPVVDFVNTEVIANGQRVDLLQTEEDLRAWFEAAELGPLIRPAGRRPGEGLLAEVKQLRAQLRAMLLRGKA